MPNRVAIETRIGANAARARDRFEVPVLAAALLVIPVVLIEETDATAWLLTSAAIVNWLIWAVFAAEYFVVVSLAERRWEYTWRSWLNVFIIVVSFPLLPGLLSATRLLRLARLGRVLRLLRLVRLAAVVTRASVAMRRIFGRAGLGYAAATTVLLALGFGTVIAVVEPEIGDPLDGIWWAVVTLTTVGYGDISPTSTGGRLLAIALMLVGIGFVAVLTAAVAAHMVDDDAGDDEVLVELRLIRERLDALEARLSGSSPTDET